MFLKLTLWGYGLQSPLKAFLAVGQQDKYEGTKIVAMT
jgi:hypothetical protein